MGRSTFKHVFHSGKKKVHCYVAVVETDYITFHPLKRTFLGRSIAVVSWAIMSMAMCQGTLYMAIHSMLFVA